jgi:CheY-like chemotaxis protein
MIDSHPLSVLVVDDSPDAAGSTAELLALAGHAVRFAVSGEDALRLAAADPPDVVLLDLWMPGMDGYAVARRLAAQTTGKPPLLVAVTGCGSAADRAEAGAAGFHLHLVKPVEPAVLLGLLRRVRETLAPPPASSPGGEPGRATLSWSRRHEYVR